MSHWVWVDAVDVSTDVDASVAAVIRNILSFTIIIGLAVSEWMSYKFLYELYVTNIIAHTEVYNITIYRCKIFF